MFSVFVITLATAEDR